MSTPARISSLASARSAPLPGGIYAICDDRVRVELSMIEKVEQLLQGGVRIMQLRFKQTCPAEAVALARQIVARCHRQRALCLINDRPDYVLLSQGDGVHLGEEDLPVRDARALLGSRCLIGATVRNAEMIEEARRQGADYVGLGPLFPSLTKEVGVSPLGLTKFQAIAAASPLPVVAISGIRLENAAQVAAAGAHAAAVISDLLTAHDIAGQARELARQFALGVKS